MAKQGFLPAVINFATAFSITICIPTKINTNYSGIGTVLNYTLYCNMNKIKSIH